MKAKRRDDSEDLARALLRACAAVDHRDELDQQNTRFNNRRCRRRVHLGPEKEELSFDDVIRVMEGNHDEQG